MKHPGFTSPIAKSHGMNPRFDRVFVVTYGRSGSTLLQGLLNAIPGYRIYGENAGFLFKLQESYEALLFAHSHLGNPKNDNESQPWFGSSRYDEESVTLEFRRFVNKMLFQPYLDRAYRVFGFKEIRFNEIEHAKIDKYLKFVKTLFPTAAVIFNTRNISDVLKSGWWRSNYWPGLPKQLSDFHDFCDSFSAENPDYAIHVAYDDLILPDRKEVARLLDFLGESLGDEELDQVFRGNHSYENRTITSYLTGRVDFITMEQPEWWRKHVDEFRIEIAPSPAGHLMAGVFLPAIGSDARLFLDSGGHRTEFVGARPTPKLETLFIANPAAGQAGFEIEAGASGPMYLYGSAGGEAESVVGVVRPRRAAPARTAGQSKAPGKEGAGKR
jgi:hypothetical protein